MIGIDSFYELHFLVEVVKNIYIAIGKDTYKIFTERKEKYAEKKNLLEY